MGLVLVGGPGAQAALEHLAGLGVEARVVSGAGELRELDRSGLRYTLVHVGPDDGEPGGTYARAHYRVGSEQVSELAPRLRTRERMLLTCLAFSYRNGMPPAADWVVDSRFLDNPYWVDELRPLDGIHPRVRAHVLEQPEAVELLDSLEALLRRLVPLYRARGRTELTVAFGCTGGRHRSVVLARELAARLQGLEGTDVEFAARDL